MYFINEQLGRILLVLAVVLTIGAIQLNPAQTPEAVPDNQVKRNVMVELNKTALAALSSETFFPTDTALTAASNRCVFEKEKQIIVFQPVELDIPPAGVKRPAQLLPEPGPSLEGSEKLPRWGDEFPKIKSGGSAAGGALGDAKTPAGNAPVGNAPADPKATVKTPVGSAPPKP